MLSSRNSGRVGQHGAYQHCTHTGSPTRSAPVSQPASRLGLVVQVLSRFPAIPLPRALAKAGALVPFPFPREGNAGTYISTMLYNVVARRSTHSALRVAGVAPFPLGALCRWMQACVLRGFACLLAFSSGGISGPWRQCGWILRTGSAVHDGRGGKSLRFYLSSRSFESWQGSWLVA